MINITATHEKMRAMIQPDNIPDALKEVNNWILWTLTPSDNKPTKVPKQTNGFKASSTNSNHWTSFDKALQAFNSDTQFTGLGFVLSATDPFCLVDLDDTSDIADPETRAKKQALVDSVYAGLPNSYTEWSPSGIGKHILVRCNPAIIPKGTNAGDVEIYTRGRYTTMTGNVVEGRNLDLVQADELVASLHSYLTGGSASQSIAAPASAPVLQSTVPEKESDREVIARASGFANGAKFQRLYNGDKSEYGEDWSRADLALVGLIQFATQNHDQIKRIFRSSALGQRDKAQREDYVNNMIAKTALREVPKLNIDYDLLRRNTEKRQAIKEAEIAEKAEQARQWQLELNANRDPASVNPERPESSPQAGFVNQTDTIVNQPPYATAEAVKVDLPPLPPAPAIDVPQLKINPGNFIGPTDEPARTKIQTYGGYTAPPSIPYPPGVAGDLCRYIYQSSIVPVEHISIVTALVFLAGVCGRSFSTGSMGLNLYFSMVALSGHGKEEVKKGTDRIVGAVCKEMNNQDAFQIIGPGTLGSGAGVHECMCKGKINFITVQSEWHKMIHRMTRDNAADHNHTLYQFLLDVYEKSGPGQFLGETALAKNNSRAMILRPAMTFVGDTNPDKFAEILSPDMVLDGLLGRFITIPHHGFQNEANYDFYKVTIDGSLLEPVCRLMTKGKEISDRNGDIPVKQTIEARTMMREFGNGSRQLYNLDTASYLQGTTKIIPNQIWNRCYAKASRVAANIACINAKMSKIENDESPIVDAEIADWAINFIVWETTMMKDMLSNGSIGESPTAATTTNQIFAAHTILREFIGNKIPVKRLKRHGNTKEMALSSVMTKRGFRRMLEKQQCFKKAGNVMGLAVEKTISQLISDNIIIDVPRGSFGTGSELVHITEEGKRIVSNE